MRASLAAGRVSGPRLSSSLHFLEIWISNMRRVSSLPFLPLKGSGMEGKGLRKSLGGNQTVEEIVGLVPEWQRGGWKKVRGVNRMGMRGKNEK